LQNIQISQSYCGDYEFNHPVSSTVVNIHASYTGVLENSVVTSLNVKYVNNLMIILAGTTSGQLLKVNNNILTDLFFIAYTVATESVLHVFVSDLEHSLEHSDVCVQN